MNTNAIRAKSLTFQFNPDMLPCAALVAGMLFATTAVTSAQSYTLVPVNPPSGSAGSTVAGLNNHGAVVGSTTVKVGRNVVAGPAFVWANGVSISLPSVGSDTSAGANDVSDSGLIVGRSGTNPARAAWWQGTAGSGYSAGDWNTQLPAGSPLFLHEAIAVTADGQFVVFDAVNTATGLPGAVVAKVQSGGLTTWTIPTAGNPPVPIVDSLAADIHSDGLTVRMSGAYSRTNTDPGHAFLWELNLLSGVVTMNDLDSAANRSSMTSGVNGSGTAAGYTYSSGLGYSAFRLSVGSAPQPLPTLGGTNSVALSINDAGYVVGWSARSGKNATAHAFLWHPTTGTRDLNALKSPSDTSVLELTTAVRINDAGQILARGVNKSSGVNVLMTPQP